MATAHRVLAVGGDRPVLVGLSKAFQQAGALFAAAADPSRLIDSAAKFAPHVILIFARPDPVDAMRRVTQLRMDPRFAKLPIILVASLPPKSTAGVTEVVPDPSDVNEFAGKIMKMLSPKDVAGPSPDSTVDLEDQMGGEILEEVSVEEIATQPAKLLLVDDDPSLLKLFSLVLRKSGFEVLTAPDGEVGLALALEHRPDLIVADLNMPRMDGWGLLRALRADHRVGETPVLFLSCHDDYRESLKALAAGAQDYVAKGGKLDALVSRVRTLLSPRDQFMASLNSSERITSKVEAVGVQWAMRAIARTGSSGMLHLKDPFWKIAVGVAGDQIDFAYAELGSHKMEGINALGPLVVVRAGELLFDPAGTPPRSNLRGGVLSLLEDAALKNNKNESEALDRLLTSAKKVEVDEQLYQLYEQLGPPSSRDIAALVRQGLTPREVIARADRSPTDVEETVRDLVRRRVLRLSA